MNLLWKFTAAPAAFLITLLQVAGATVPYDAPGSGIKAPGGASGFFRTEKVDGRWWFVDPNGELFFALGTDWVNADGFNKAYTRIIKEKYGTTEKWAAATVKRLKSWGMNHLGTSNTPELRGKGLAYSHGGAGFARQAEVSRGMEETAQCVSSGLGGGMSGIRKIADENFSA